MASKSTQKKTDHTLASITSLDRDLEPVLRHSILDFPLIKRFWGSFAKPNIIVRWIAIVTAAIGVAGLAGWVFAVPMLKSALPGAVEIKPNTALCLLLSAAALFLLSDAASRTQRILAQGCALIVTVAGIATLGQNAFGWQLGIDELLFRDAASGFNDAIRGRMSPYSAIAFAFLGIALASLSRPTLRPIVWLGGFSIMSIGTFSVFGYLWNAHDLTSQRYVPPVGLHTTVAFVLLGVGLFMAQQERAPASSPLPITVERRVFMSFVGAMVLLVTAGGYTYRAGVEFAESARWVNHTQEVRASLAALYSSVVYAQSEQREYLLTGRETRKGVYISEVYSIDSHLRKLSGLLADNTKQLENAIELSKLIQHRIDVLDQSMATFETAGLGGVQQVIAQDPMTSMDGIRQLVGKMDEAERGLVIQHEANFAKTQELTLVALLVTISIGAVIFAFLFRGIRHEMRVRAQAETDALDASAAKGKFLATMSHEIRTPLSALLGMLELIGMSRLDGQQRQFLEVAQDSGNGLLRIINDVLDHAKIDAGKLEIRAEPVSIADIVRRVANTFGGVASAKNLTITVIVDEHISALLVADGDRISQILGNFVSNALKFTEKGQVEVRAELINVAGSIETVRLCVVDTGVGIAEEVQMRLFQPFEQAGADTSRMYGGTGLGLAICRSLADLMGGTIAMQSKQGEGTTMSLTLALEIAQESRIDKPLPAAEILPGQESAPVITTTTAHLPILAVDDHPTNRRLLGVQLSMLGLQAKLVASAEEALSLWRSEKYSLMITDCNMPGMDGYALTQRIREIENQERRVRITIIAWTANVLPSVVSQCHAAGMDEVLTKPAELQKLKKTLSKWLGALPCVTSASASNGSGTQGFIKDAKILDPDQLDRVSASLGERKEILDDFLAQTRSDLATLNYVIKEQDFAAAGLVAHRIKGASRIVGASQITAVCEMIENAARQGKLHLMQQAEAPLCEAIEQVALCIAQKQTKDDL